MARSFPLLVCQLVELCDAWIIGSAVNTLNPRDYDVVVPMSFWPQAASLIPKDAKVNAYGGWKCISEGKEVDVWPGELGMFLQRASCYGCWQPKYGVKYFKDIHAK